MGGAHASALAGREGRRRGSAHPVAHQTSLVARAEAARAPATGEPRVPTHQEALQDPRCVRESRPVEEVRRDPCQVDRGGARRRAGFGGRGKLAFLGGAGRAGAFASCAGRGWTGLSGCSGTVVAATFSHAAASSADNPRGALIAGLGAVRSSPVAAEPAPIRACSSRPQSRAHPGRCPRTCRTDWPP